MAFPWNPTVNGYPMSLKLKVWLKLKHMSPQAWCVEHLIAGASSFGIILDHAPMNKVNSIDIMLAVVAVPKLGVIPHGLRMWIRRLARDVEVIVRSWLEEPISLATPTNPTPTQQDFAKIQNANVKVATNISNPTDNRQVITIDSNMLFTIWSGLDSGPEKDRLYQTVKSSPLFEEYLKEKAIENFKAREVVTPAIPVKQKQDPLKKMKGILLSNELDKSGDIPTGEQRIEISNEGSTRPTLPRTCFLPTQASSNSSRT